MEESEGPVLRPDHWACVAQFLSVRDLCCCMRVSHEWFHMWVADRMWTRHRRRLCREAPELTALFEQEGLNEAEHTSSRSRKSNSNKKRKTAWLVPRKGAWHVFAHWIGPSLGHRLRKLPHRDPRTHAVLAAVVRSHVPNGHRFYEVRVEYEPRGTTMYRITAWLKVKDSDGPGHRLHCRIPRLCYAFGWSFWDTRAQDYCSAVSLWGFACRPSDMQHWRCLVFGKECNSHFYWTDFLQALMNTE